jgi:hypothetical protein
MVRYVSRKGSQLSSRSASDWVAAIALARTRAGAQKGRGHGGVFFVSPVGL